MPKHIVVGAIAGGILFGGIASAISSYRPPLQCADLLDPLASAVQEGVLEMSEAESIYKTCLANPELINQKP